MPRFSADLFGRKRKGFVAVFVCVSMIFVLGMAALTIDGGMLLDRRRHAQATADAAAMAAASVLYTNYPANHGVDSNGAARAAALSVASCNGFTNDGTVSVVTVNIPPASGPYAGKASYAEVLVTYNQPLSFGRIFGSSSKPVTARAVARGAWVPNAAGVIVLDYSGKSALNSQGNGAFTETAGPVIVNSDNGSAVSTSGNGSMAAEAFFITGSATLNGGGTAMITTPIPNQIFVGVHPTPDPLAYLPQPSVPSDGTITTTNIGMGNKQYVLTPGRFTNLPTFNTGDQVILEQASANNNGGIFYIDGGGFKSTGASITMDPSTSGGVMIYNSPQSTALSEKIQITGNSSGTVNLSPLTNGPYTGFMLWQDRASSVNMQVDGNGSFTVKGTFYAAGALLNVTGNGGTYVDAAGNAQNGSQIGSQFAVKDLGISGNGNIALKFPGMKANTRVLTLVE